MAGWSRDRLKVAADENNFGCWRLALIFAGWKVSEGDLPGKKMPTQ
jgi:hypothetical protein